MRGVTGILLFMAVSNLFNVSYANNTSHICNAKHAHHSTIINEVLISTDSHHPKHYEHSAEGAQSAKTEVKSESVYPSSTFCKCTSCACSFELCGSVVLLTPTLSIPEKHKNQLPIMFNNSKRHLRFLVRLFRPPKTTWHRSAIFQLF